LAAVWLLPTLAVARDAAFMDPGSGSNSVNVGDAIKVEPKNEIDIGDSALNTARRTTLFFVNQTNLPIKIEKIVVNSDSNVTAIISNDDCSKQETLAPSSRCSVEVALTPIGPGTWGSELLMTHNGAGRLTRAKITGKTAGSGGGDKKDSGLFLSTKEIKPVDFGDINAGEGKIVRSALMINDSPAPISIFSIDVIEAEKDLQRLDQGCAIDMELKPGESCPVTLVWTPLDKAHISTDLIIRHSGQLGFTVIPVRGIAHGDAAASSKDATEKALGISGNNRDNKSSSGIPLPPSAPDLAHLVDKMPSVAASALATSGGAVSDSLHLIGTVGNRALIYKPDGSTAVVQASDVVEFDEHKAKIITIAAKEVSIVLDGRPKKLTLEAVQELTARARQTKQAAAASNTNGSSSRAGSPLAPLPSTNGPTGSTGLTAPGTGLAPSGGGTNQ
jgi:hypothetical protein